MYSYYNQQQPWDYRTMQQPMQMQQPMMMMPTPMPPPPPPQPTVMLRSDGGAPLAYGNPYSGFYPVSSENSARSLDAMAPPMYGTDVEARALLPIAPGPPVQPCSGGGLNYASNRTLPSGFATASRQVYNNPWQPMDAKYMA